LRPDNAVPMEPVHHQNRRKRG